MIKKIKINLTKLGIKSVRVHSLETLSYFCLSFKKPETIVLIIDTQLLDEHTGKIQESMVGSINYWLIPYNCWNMHGD